jgi:hypothetical protein
MALAH